MNLTHIIPLPVKSSRFSLDSANQRFLYRKSNERKVEVYGFWEIRTVDQLKEISAFKGSMDSFPVEDMEEENKA